MDNLDKETIARWIMALEIKISRLTRSLKTLQEVVQVLVELAELEKPKAAGKEPIKPAALDTTKRRGWPLSPHRPAILKAYREGTTGVRAIATYLGISPSTVSRTLKDAGLSPRKRGKTA